MATSTTTTPAQPMRAGMLWAALGVLGVGVIIALYLVDLKLSLLYSEQSGAGCNDMGEGFSCDKVNLSEYSTVFGLPLSLYAIPTYFMMGYLAWWGIRALQTATPFDDEDGRSGVALAGSIGLLTCVHAVYLFFISTSVIGAKCVWCMALYGVNFGATFLLIKGSGLKVGDAVRRGVDAVLGLQGPVSAAVGILLISGGAAWGWYDREALLEKAINDARGMAMVDASYGVAAGAGPAPAAPAPSTAVGAPATATPAAPVAAAPVAAAARPGAAAAAPAPAPAAAPVVMNTTLAPVKNINPDSARPFGQKTKDGWTNFDIPMDPPNEHWAGNPNAKVTVVKFADFQCQYCKFLAKSMEPLKKEFGDKVRFVMRHFPMNGKCNYPMRNYDKHPYACEASYAGHCAGMQGKFWEMHDTLYANQNDLEPGNLRAYASEVGLNVTEFDRCMADPTTKDAIAQDIKVAYKAQIHGTPRTYINGRLVMGSASTNVLKYHLTRAIKEAEAGGAPAAAAAAAAAAPAAAARPAARPAAPKAAPMAPKPDGRSMIAVKNATTTFFIDPYEQVIMKDGTARSAPGQKPSQVSWYDAKAACEKANKRMCTEQEWITACAGEPAIDNNKNRWFSDDDLEGNMYPYGPYHTAGSCHDQGDKYNGRPVPSGSKAKCRTRSGIFDLTGNIGEWVNPDEKKATLMGGHNSSGEGARCNARSYGSGVGRRNHTTGFRCCADSNVKQPGKVNVADIVRKPTTLMGQPVPKIDAKSSDGKAIDAKFFKGKVTLVNFFASWCGPCKKEFPFLVNYQKTLGPKGFQVVAFGTDSTEKRSLDFAKQYDPNFAIVADTQSKASGVFGVHSMPATFLVDRKGVIRYLHTGFKPEEDAAPLKRAIEKLL